MRVLFLGRFQPFHLGHASVLHELSEHEVVIGIGSAYASHTMENPFTCSERIEMVLASGYRPLALVPIPDINRYSVWTKHVESIAPRFDMVVTHTPRDRELFIDAGYKIHEVPLFDRKDCSGRNIRELMASSMQWSHLVPQGSKEVIEKISGVDRVKIAFETARGTEME